MTFLATKILSVPNNFYDKRVKSGILTGWNYIVDVNTVNQFKACLDKFWVHQHVKYDFTADLTGIGDRLVHETYDVYFCM